MAVKRKLINKSEYKVLMIIYMNHILSQYSSISFLVIRYLHLYLSTKQFIDSSKHYKDSAKAQNTEEKGTFFTQVLLVN